MAFQSIDFSDKRAIARRLLLFFPIFAAVNIIIVYLFTDISDLLKIREFYPGYLLIAAGLRLIPWFMKAFRLQNWMHFLKRKLSYWDGVRISIWSELGACITPTAIGGQPIKMGLLYQRGLPAGEAASVTSLAVFEDIVAHAVGIPIALTTGWILHLGFFNKFAQILQSKALALGVSVVGVGVLVLIWNLIRRDASHPGKIRLKLFRFWVEFKTLYRTTIRYGKTRFFLNSLFSAIQWSGRYAVTGVLAIGLGYEANLFVFIVVQMLIFALMSLVPTPGASGGAEGLFLLFFSSILPASAIGTMLIGWRILDFYFLGILSLIYIGFESIFHRSAALSTEESE
ncbi:MAG: flippase-like domain-containing protein [Candidatus Marinimicrobia bacterium]|nr:flippase-like domain-containing protein [Candidatus Neomarinimicrobiota bacterium]MCF7829401.1 flippase-like domain-containing protein [Candidatus Neomarinimicrobiota bacterium]MCF7880887.1 flippase-like domain-containing protein [Candidatus Neomarinimicrobiota bacterium]